MRDLQTRIDKLLEKEELLEEAIYAAETPEERALYKAKLEWVKAKLDQILEGIRRAEGGLAD